MRLSHLSLIGKGQVVLALVVLGPINMLTGNWIAAAESDRACNYVVASSVSSLAIHPQNPAILYAGTSYDGVFKSIDSGTTWRAINIGLSDNSTVDALVIDPQTPTTLYAYAGRQEGFAGKWQRSLFKSTDEGASWQPMNSVGIPDGFSLSALAIDPQSSATLYSYVRKEASQENHLLQSTDAGAMWHIVSSDLPTYGIKTLMVDPRMSTVLYAGAGGGVFKSADSGKTWTAMNTGLQGNYSLSVTALAMDPQVSTTLYAQAGESIGSGAVWVSGLFRSVDGGGQWQKISDGPPTLPLQVSQVNALVVAPQTPSTLYGGTDAGLFKSIDGGITWQASHTGLVGITAGDLVLDSKTPMTVYGVTRGKVFKSVNGGTSWQAMVTTGLTAHMCGLILEPQTSTTMYAWTLDGLFKSVDGGTNWRASNAGLPNTMVRDLIIDRQMPTTLYAGIDGYHGGGEGGVFKSKDGGRSWKAMNNGLGDLSVYALALDPHMPTTLYAMTSHFHCTYKSTDAGETWQEIKDCDSESPFILTFDPQTPTTLYAIKDRNVAKSTDGGTTWRLSDSGLPVGVSINALTVDSKTPTTLYVRTSDGVFKSTNGGGVWESINAGLSGTRVSDLALDPQTPTTLYVWTRGGGVFKSTDAGTTWRAANAGLF